MFSIFVADLSILPSAGPRRLWQRRPFPGRVHGRRAWARPCPKAIRKKYYSWRIGGDRTRFFGDPRGDRGLVAVVTDRRRSRYLTDEFTSVLGRYELYGGRVWRFGSGNASSR